MHPYENLDDKYFWATAVARRSMFDISDLWDPRFDIGRNTSVATFGSCFAQHIGRALRRNGFNWLITEPTPSGLNADSARKFNYDVFSARTGNIYTASLFRQWVNWSVGDESIPSEIWQQGDRYFDPFRPNIEPNGFESERELLRSREMAVSAFHDALIQSRVLVFTLGLTESWINTRHGYEYPMCPGTVAGEFDGDQHEFLNQDFPFIRDTLSETMQRVRALNPEISFLLTVSPVPLTATKSGNHVLVATTESKSVLRAVAGSLQRVFEFVDYFPSYEIINATPFRGTFFEPNQRNVNPAGVDHVMRMFFACLNAKFGDKTKRRKKRAVGRRRKHGDIPPPVSPAESDRDVACEEELLNAFAKS